MRNLERLVKKLEMRTSRMFESEKPFCIHRKPIITYPDGTIEGGLQRCKICQKPNLKISIGYTNCEGERKNMLSEAKHLFAELENDSEFRSLEREQLIEILCQEFDVARGDLLVSDPLNESG